MNESVFTYFYSFAHRNPWLDFVISFTAEWYGLVILTALFIYLFKHRDNLRKGVTDLVVVSVSAVFAWFIAHFFKDVFHTLRPFDVLSWVKPLVSESGFAFPSGHATFFMALASVLWYYHRYLAIFFGFSAVLIGLARIAVGIHWPFDILAGWFLGGVVGVLAYYVLNYRAREKS